MSTEGGQHQSLWVMVDTVPNKWLNLKVEFIDLLHLAARGWSQHFQPYAAHWTVVRCKCIGVTSN